MRVPPIFVACVIASLAAVANPSGICRGILPTGEAGALPQDDAKLGKDGQPPAPSDSWEVRFSGEVLRGQIYEHDVGHHMVFRLTPDASDEGGGWVIGMLPSAEPAEDPLEFVEIATPPYHGYNERYVAATAGYSAREAIAITTRKFYFVESVQDEHIASEVVNAALYPSTVSEAERLRIDAESVRLHLGSGEFRIVRSHIVPGRGGVPDTIAWVKFDVALNFSPAVTLQSVLAPRVLLPR